MSGIVSVRDQLRVLHAVTEALARVADITEGAESLVASIGRGLEWDFGALWLANDDRTLRAAATWHRSGQTFEEYERITRSLRFQPGSGLPGKAWEGGAMWVEDLAQHPGFSRRASAIADNLRSAVLFPIESSGDVLGVFEFVSRLDHASDPDLLETLNTVGRLIGLYLGRIRIERALLEKERRFGQELEARIEERTGELERQIEARRATEERLRASQAQLRRFYESDIIGIIVADVHGRVKEANDAFLRLVGFTREDVESGALRWDTLTPPEWKEADARAIQEFLERGSSPPTEKEFFRKDGSRVPVLYAGALLEGTGGEGIAFVLDMSAQKAVERQLAETNESLERRVDERTRSLQESQQRLLESERMLRALAARIETIREEERASLAREIHDVLGQEITGLKMDAAWVLRRLTAAHDPAAIVQRLEGMLHEIDSLVVTVQRIARDLRPGVLDDLGLAAALEWQARDFESRSGIAVQLELTNDEPRVDRARATAIFRIFQELLTNVARHARAHCVRASLRDEGDCLKLEVVDDGCGIGEPRVRDPSSLGLAGIRERTRAFGGDFAISGKPGEGTRATVRIGLRSPEGPSE